MKTSSNRLTLTDVPRDVKMALYVRAGKESLSSTIVNILKKELAKELEALKQLDQIETPV